MSTCTHAVIHTHVTACSCSYSPPGRPVRLQLFARPCSWSRPTANPSDQAAGRAWPLVPGQGTACSAAGIGPPGPRSVARGPRSWWPAAGGRGRVCVCMSAWRVFVILATNSDQVAAQLVPELPGRVPGDVLRWPGGRPRPGACGGLVASAWSTWCLVRGPRCLVRDPWPVARRPGGRALVACGLAR